MSLYNYKTVQRSEDIPVGKHWAIMTFGSITIPGHGYPESTQTTTTYKLYTTEAAWIEDIERLENPRYGTKEPYIALIVERPAISAKVQVQVKVGT